jgi:predicted permease
MPLMDAFSRDIRQGIRGLGRTPAFTAIAVGTVALGIAAVTSMATVVSAALVRPLPFEDPGELYELRKVSRGGERVSLALPELTEWQRHNRSFAAIAGSTGFDFNLGDHRPVTISAAAVTAGYLELLGARMHLGRAFVDSEYAPGSERVVILTYPFWQERFGGDRRVLGKTLDLEGPFHLSDSTGTYTIVGVLTPDFWHFYDRTRTHVVLPLRASSAQMADRRNRIVERVVGRGQGLDTRAASAELSAVAVRFEGVLPGSDGSASVQITPLGEAHFGSFRSSLTLLLAATCLVALIAAVNVALLFLARGRARSRETAVRAALGATRFGLMRLQVLETTVITLAGAAFGVTLSLWSMDAIRRLIPGGFRNLIPGGVDAIVFDGTTLTAVSVVTLLVAVCSSSAPAWVAFRTNASAVLRTGRVLGWARISMERVLVVTEVALAVTLLAGASLLLNTLIRLNRVDLGISPPPGIVAWINLNLSRYPDNASKRQFYDRVIEMVDAQPGVTTVTAIDLPFNFEWQRVPFAVQGQALSDSRQLPRALDRSVSPGYFAHHGIVLRRGRWFDRRDTASSAITAIVSDTLARRTWPDLDPIGRRLWLFDDVSVPVAATVIGVVSDIRSGPRRDPMPIVYRPYAQHPPPWLYLSVEGVARADVLLDAVREAVSGVDPRQPVDGPWTLDEWVRDQTNQTRLMSRLAALFAGFATVLAGLGVYGVIAHMVLRRVPEFGLRMAIGATPARIFWSASTEALYLAAIGTVLGIAGAIATMRTLAGLLFGISPTDPLTLAAVVTLFGLIAWSASVIPALRAARVDPSMVLRAD